MPKSPWMWEHQRPKGARSSLSALAAAMIGAGSVVAGLSFGQNTPQETINHTSIAEPPTRVLDRGTFKGRITAQESRKPIEGARLRIMVEGLPQEDSFLEVASDNAGNFSCEVPLGDLRVFGLFPPAGYFFDDAKSYQSVFTTKKEPVVAKNYVLQAGTSWKVELAGFSGAKDKSPYLSWSYDPLDLTNHSEMRSTIRPSAQGEAVLALPPEGGQFVLRATESTSPSRYEIPEVRLKVEEGFNPAQMAGEAMPIAGEPGVQWKDRSGKTATLRGAEVVRRDGQAIIRIPCTPIPQSRAFKAIGTVRDGKGHPISQAKLTAAFLSGNSKHPSHLSHLVAHSDADGQFTMPEILLPATYLDGHYRMELVASKPGFAALETQALNLAELQKTGIANFGTITMRAEKILKGKVIDEQGNPLHGAVVRSFGNAFAHGHLTCRTDADGRFQIPQLAYGKMMLYANCAEFVANEDFTFDEKTGEHTLTIRRMRND
jgi:hypothetical protein